MHEGGDSLGADVSDLEGSVFLVTGIPAAGKSTVADGLARRFARSVHVRGDEFRRMVVSGRVVALSEPQDADARAVALLGVRGVGDDRGHQRDGLGPSVAARR